MICHIYNYVYIFIYPNFIEELHILQNISQIEHIEFNYIILYTYGNFIVERRVLYFHILSHLKVPEWHITCKLLLISNILISLWSYVQEILHPVVNIFRQE